MRRVLPLLPAALLALVGCDAAAPDGPPAPEPGAAAQVRGIDRSHAGTPAPDIEFEDPDGEPTSIEAFRGRPLLVNLWATWCAPCIVEMPSLDALAGRAGKRLQVLALSQDLEGRQKVADFFEERKLGNLDPFLDSQMAFMTALRIGTLPTSILYDSKGREVWRMTGIEDWQSERAAALLAEADRN